MSSMTGREICFYVFLLSSIDLVSISVCVYKYTRKHEIDCMCSIPDHRSMEGNGR